MPLTDLNSYLDEELAQPWESGEPWGLGAPQKGVFDDIPPLAHDPALDEKPELKPNQNAAQAWKQNPGNMGGVAQVQQRNRELLKPRSESTNRYYTRQLYREQLLSRDPNTRMQARIGLRIRGAGEKSGRDQMVSNRTAMGQKVETWEDIFPTRPGQKPSPEMSPIGRTAGTPESKWRKIFGPLQRNDGRPPQMRIDPATANLRQAEDFIDEIIDRNLTQRT